MSNIAMIKLKAVFLLSLILFVVSAAGCLNKFDPVERPFDLSSINPLNKDIEPYQPHPENIPSGEGVFVYRPGINVSFPAYQYESLEPKSDMAFYGTIQTVGPSGFYVLYERFSFIITPVTFEVDYLIKGENTETVTAMLCGGQVGDYIMTDYSYPLVWDLKEGQQYLVYLKTNNDIEGY